MKIYAELNTSNQIINETDNPTCPDGYIEVKEPRPTNEHVAQEDGTWRYVEPEKEIPSITRRQARLKLLDLGLLDKVEALVYADGNKALAIEYETDKFERSSPLFNQIGESFELSDAQVDDLFIEASKL